MRVSKDGDIPLCNYDTVISLINKFTLIQYSTIPAPVFPVNLIMSLMTFPSPSPLLHEPVQGQLFHLVVLSLGRLQSGAFALSFSFIPLTSVKSIVTAPPAPTF